MSDVRRYDLDTDTPMRVRYVVAAKDYDAILAERDALRAEIERLKRLVEAADMCAAEDSAESGNLAEMVIAQRNELAAVRAENAELRKHAEAFDKMRKALQGIAACATQCEGCQMMARIAREALK